MNLVETSVFIVDDDAVVRCLLEELITSVGLKTESFSSAREFLNTLQHSQQHSQNPCCLVSDIRMPGMSGLELQDELLRKGISIPIIFVTGFGTVAMSVRAMKSGAVDFLLKPFENQELLDAVHLAIDKNKKTKSQLDKVSKIKQGIKTLTQREYEILEFVINGTLNKGIANHLNISESTVKTHRRHIMQKMKFESLAELIQAIEKYKIYSQENYDSDILFKNKLSLVK